jgi:hypothetical protein
MNYDLQNANKALLVACEKFGTNHPNTLAIRDHVHALRSESQRREMGNKGRGNVAASIRNGLSTLFVR